MLNFLNGKFRPVSLLQIGITQIRWKVPIALYLGLNPNGAWVPLS